ncbi:MAG: PA2779 family protein [Burkholderiaceae bacterium]|nr:PA2779 family protein [Burkholderiaceae bacterium]
MTTRTKRALATLVAMSLNFASLAQAAPLAPSAAVPALIGTEQAAAAQPGRTLLEQTLARADVVAALQARGVGIDAARDRVAALTDAEAAHVAAQIDQAPAGGDVLGVIVTIFVVLLITDILGFTKVFPFTRAIR